MKLQEVILRDTEANKPDASTVPIGTLFYATDSGITERSDGTDWESYADGVVASLTLPHTFFLMGA